MKFAVTDVDLKLHPGDETEAQRAGAAGGLAQTREDVVVGQGDRGQTERGGGLHEERGRKLTVGMGGVGVQVYHRRSSGFLGCDSV